MTNKGNRREGQPILILNGKTIRPDRILFDVKEFNEGWIQELIHKHPDILPTKEIEAVFHPLIPIGREISTGAGSIDNLLISPEGYLTIVETKLWRNPEARREVVGQIIDYAKELNKWSFDDLNKRVIKFNQGNNNSDGLWSTVRNKAELDESEEISFIDNVSKNLKRGRFLLLIVGDGIRESVEDMVEYLTQTPQLYFTLALIELQVYKLNQNENSLIVIPQIVTRTTEIERAVVRIEGNYPVDMKVNIETVQGTEITKGKYKRLTIQEQEYFEQLEKNTKKEIVEVAKKIIKDCEDLELQVEWLAASFTIRLTDPKGSGIKIPILNIDTNGRVKLGFSGGAFNNLGLSRESSYRFAAETAALLPGIEQRPDKQHLWKKDSTLNSLSKVYQHFMDKVQKYIDDITTEGERAADNIRFAAMLADE